jgi:alanyl-tRNA synthetase
MTASEILNKYISFFEKQGHTRIENSSLVPLNDPTTLFTSSGMQPLVPYLLGEEHPQGTRLVNAQNCFRAQDIDEIGDNRHTTFFRMLGNWSLGDYFKKEQIPWFFEFLTKELGLDSSKLYVSVFEGWEKIPKDTESAKIWKEIFEKADLNPEEHIFYYGVEKNWWSRSGVPENMPAGEPGGPDTEVFYDFGTPHDQKFGDECHINCDCGRFLEIGNSVFMQYQRQADGSFKNLPKQNVDFGGGLERLVAVTEDKQDVFQTSLLRPVIDRISEITKKEYKENAHQMRIITDHFTASIFISANDVMPSNKEQGYVLRRLIRRGLDNFYALNGLNIDPILEQIVEQYKDTDPYLVEKYEHIKSVIFEEEQSYKKALEGGKRLVEKELKIQGKLVGDELLGQVEITADTAFKAITSFGLGPTQLKSLGYVFDEEALAEKIKQHQEISRKGAEKKFAGGLADSSEKTVMGHTATHLLQQALRDILGDSVHQTGSNITSERIRFDFNLDRKLTDEEIQKAESIVNEKIKENLPVHFEMMPVAKAKDIGAIGLFDEKYAENVKVYFIGEYSKEFCGGPHVDFTGALKRFKIIKEEGLGKTNRRIYANVGEN